KHFGQSYDRLTSGVGFETRYYENKASHLTFEVNVQDSMVTTVKVLQTGPADITPFYLGMTMQDLTKLTTIYTNFTFEYHDTEVGIELMEEDMNYRPLIAFDNDT
ncbi:CAP-associated domain-containing protein, partial [Enterococcus faecium]|uniref:CAP-associated domain-containing protein n=1 Tax=Enterococcus faecium TaxID=1352 RepID=UPI003CF81CF0